MRVVIVGAGVVGFHLADQLSREGHDVSVVDADPALVRTLDEKLDLLAIAGDAATPSVLLDAGVKNADLVVAVTDRDTTNIVVSLIARRLGAKKRIVRVRTTEFSSEGALLDREDIGADMIINPIDTTASMLTRLVRNPGATDVAEFADGDLLLWGFVVSPNSTLVGIKLKELRQHAEETHALIVAIARPDGSLVVPTGEDEIGAGDNIYVFIHRKATKGFRRLVNPDERSVERVVIAGASQLSIELARRLEGRVKKIVIVEPDRQLAEAASEQVTKSTVLCGDIGDTDFIHEYDMQGVDYFLALADDDQTNLMNSMLMHKQGVPRIAVLTQHPRFIPVLRSLGLGVVVNPRLLTVSAILLHIRRGSVLKLSQVGESGAEAREYEVTEGSALAGKALKDLTLPRGVIIGAIFRNHQYTIPTGNSVPEVGDHVIIFALPEAIEATERLFSKKRFFGK